MGKMGNILKRREEIRMEKDLERKVKAWRVFVISKVYTEKSQTCLWWGGEKWVLIAEQKVWDDCSHWSLFQDDRTLKEASQRLWVCYLAHFKKVIFLNSCQYTIAIYWTARGRRLVWVISWYFSSSFLFPWIKRTFDILAGA